MFKLTKEHEGKEMWCIPTQNNVSRWGENAGNALAQAELKMISDVKRVYVTIGHSKHSFADYNQGEGYAQYDTKHNSGWIVFETEEHFTEYREHLQNVDLIKEKLTNCYARLPITDCQTKRIAEILREGE